LGLQRMHAITEDGRIFVTDEGQNDISGATVAEISTQLVTRAYDTENLNHFQRRLYLDVATNRASFSASAFTEGANEESVLLTNQTYSRSQSWKFKRFHLRPDDRQQRLQSGIPERLFDWTR